MDWTLAIRRNREALERVLAGLFALVGIEDWCGLVAYAPSPARLSPCVLSPRGEGTRRSCRLPLLPAGEKVVAKRPDEGAVEIVRDCPAGKVEKQTPGPEPLLLPRHLHTHAMRILRAAEAAIRRLIVIAARDIAIRPPQPSSPAPCGEVSGRQAAGWGSLQGHSHNPTLRVDLPTDRLRLPAFPLLDPLKRHSFEPPRRASKFMPRICVVGVSEPEPLPDKPAPSPDDPISAAGLCRRLLSSRRALADLPREARRFARWNARNVIKRSQSQGKGRISPLRIGRPPGWRRHPAHPADDILKECHALALDALSPPDTS